jgi:CDP-diacylglycerol--serine O-phosphatidyltransferase
MSGIRRPRRGIFLLPTFFTVGNLFCGFTSLIQSSREAFEVAAALILVAGVLDMVDGRIARLTGTTSEFGLQFDSLADLVSFGVAPAYLAWHWGLAPLHRLGWGIAFLFVVSAAMRLARFNMQVAGGSKRYFAGLPTPPAAAAVACTAFAVPEPPASSWIPALFGAVVALLAVLMISRVRYRSFKDIDLRNRRSFVYVLPLAVAVCAVAYTPAITVVSLAAAYVLSGPLGWLASAARRAGGGPAEEPADSSNTAEVVLEPIGR